MENSNEIDDLGGKPGIFGNIHMYSQQSLVRLTCLA